MIDDEQLTVFVVDDDKAIRASLRRALGLRGYSVETYASARDFLAAWDGRRQGCLILDYGMPGMNGLELQEHINALGLKIPIIFITGHGGVPESVRAIKAGALDFLEKPFRQADLVDRINNAFAIAREFLNVEVSTRDRESRYARLTAREQEIVDWMINNPSGITSKEIALQLGISPRTVDHHRARILEKMGVRSVAELIAIAKS